MAGPLRVSLPDGTIQEVNLQPGEDPAQVESLVRRAHMGGALPEPAEALAGPQAQDELPPRLPQPNAPSQLSTWEKIKDIAAGFGSGGVAGTGNVSRLEQFATKDLPFPAGVVKHAVVDPVVQFAQQHLFGSSGGDLTSKAVEAAGGNFKPETTPGKISKSVGEGIAGQVLTGGVGKANTLRDLLFAGGSGYLGERGQEAAGTAGGVVGSMAPYLAAGLGKAWLNPGGSVYASARTALERDALAKKVNEQAGLQGLAGRSGYSPTPEALEGLANDYGLPGTMAWQLRPADSAVRILGQRSAISPGGEALQNNLLTQQPKARQLVANTGTEGTPQNIDPVAHHLSGNLANDAQLINRDLSAAPGASGQHEAGPAALMMELAEKFLPHDWKVASPAMPFVASSGLRHFAFGGPTEKARAKLFGLESNADFERAAAYNPRMDALKNVFRAYFSPEAQGQLPPGEQ